MVFLIVYLATMLVQSYQVFNKLSLSDDSEDKAYYADINYAFCIIIFGQVVGIMCAKMGKLLTMKEQFEHLSPDSQILIADMVYLVILTFLHRRFSMLFAPEEECEEKSDQTKRVFLTTGLLLLASTMTVLMLRILTKNAGYLE